MSLLPKATGAALVGNLRDARDLARRMTANRLRLAFAVAIASLIVVLFHLLGNTVESVNTRSVFVWMFHRWRDPISYGSDYSIGWLIPFVSAWFVWRRRRELAAAPTRICGWGLAAVALALALHWVGARMQQTRISLAALVLLLWALPLYFHGPRVARLLLFPCAYLLLCIPLNFLDAFTFPLRLFSTKVAASLLNGVGLPVVRAGTIVYPASEQGVSFNVADPCSGLHSLLAMIALTAAYGYLVQRGAWRKLTLFVLAVPLAIVGNVVRIFSVALVGRLFGSEAAMTVYHDYSGYLVFASAILLMLACSRILDNLDPEAWRAWMHAKSEPA